MSTLFVHQHNRPFVMVKNGQEFYVCMYYLCTREYKPKIYTFEKHIVTKLILLKILYGHLCF